jgi:hypothetical protein
VNCVRSSLYIVAAAETLRTGSVLLNYMTCLQLVLHKNGTMYLASNY